MMPLLADGHGHRCELTGAEGKFQPRRDQAGPQAGEDMDGRTPSQKYSQPLPG